MYWSVKAAQHAILRSMMILTIFLPEFKTQGFCQKCRDRYKWNISGVIEKYKLFFEPKKRMPYDFSSIRYTQMLVCYQSKPQVFLESLTWDTAEEFYGFFMKNIQPFLPFDYSTIHCKHKNVIRHAFQDIKVILSILKAPLSIHCICPL